MTPPIWVVPHDAQAKSLGTGRSIEALARNAGWRARIVPRLSVADDINAVRTIFPVMWFDSARCAGDQATGGRITRGELIRIAFLALREGTTVLAWDVPLRLDAVRAPLAAVGATSSDAGVALPPPSVTVRRRRPAAEAASDD